MEQSLSGKLAGIALPDSEGQEIRLGSLWADSPAVLVFLRRDNATARKRARAAGHRQHRIGKNPFQLGGSFVFGPGNVDHYAHISETFGDNASPASLLAALP